MCGICGIINQKGQPVEQAKVQQMMRKMKHRGPDDEGFFIDQNTGFGHVRLSIIDLSKAGHQPMVDETGNFVLTFNGEIYNYIELKKELKQLGHSFASQSDTEVLLKAYMAWGKDCLHKLNGMFAFAILDKRNQSVFISRDRFGIKPLYFYHNNGQFIFASEIKPILEVYDTKREPNMGLITSFLLYNRTDYNTETFFNGIHKLSHGSYITIKDARVEVKRWYQINEYLNRPATSAEEYKSLFEDAVSLRLRSDVPVGVCLSGGLDSSAIASTLQGKFNIKNLNTFSAVYGQGIEGDESSFINEYQAVFRNMHFVTPTGDSLFDDLEDLIATHPEPFTTTSIYAQYKVMNLAQNKVKVLLDGQGADEHLAGYHYFFGYYFAQLFRQIKWVKLLMESSRYFSNHRSSYAYKVTILSLFPRITKKGVVDNDSLISPELFNQFSEIPFEIKQLSGSKSLLDALLNHFEYKLEHLLKWEDLNSMRFSIESRTPFLDYRLVETSLSQNSKKLISQGQTKVILRESLKNVLPDKIKTRQDKVGFKTPTDDWFRENKYQDFIIDLLNSSAFRQRKIINTNGAIKLYEKHLKGEVNQSKNIWKWICLELWFLKYIDNK